MILVTFFKKKHLIWLQSLEWVLVSAWVFLVSGGLGLPQKQNRSSVFLLEFLIPSEFSFLAVLLVKTYRKDSAIIRYTVPDATLCLLTQRWGGTEMTLHCVLSHVMIFCMTLISGGASGSKWSWRVYLQGKYQRWVNKETLTLVARSGSHFPLTNWSLKSQLLLNTFRVSLLAPLQVTHLPGERLDAFSFPKEWHSRASS